MSKATSGSWRVPKPSSSVSLSVSVEGIGYSYRLTDDDLEKVFSRYGLVTSVQVTEDSSAVVSFALATDAARAMKELDGKRLSGVQATLRVSQLEEAVSSFQLPFASAEKQSLSTTESVPIASLSFQETPPASCYSRAAPFATPLSEPVSESPPLLPESSTLRKFTCRIDIPVENEKDFQVARRIIGQKGANMKKIVAASDAKLRLRGRGSGYLEGFNRTECPEPLHMCVSCVSKSGYETAVKLVKELIESVMDEYRQWLKAKGEEISEDLNIVVKENPLGGLPISSEVDVRDQRGKEKFWRESKMASNAAPFIPSGSWGGNSWNPNFAYPPANNYYNHGENNCFEGPNSFPYYQNFPPTTNYSQYQGFHPNPPPSFHPLSYQHSYPAPPPSVSFPFSEFDTENTSFNPESAKPAMTLPMRLPPLGGVSGIWSAEH